MTTDHDEVDWRRGCGAGTRSWTFVRAGSEQRFSVMLDVLDYLLPR